MSSSALDLIRSIDRLLESAVADGGAIDERVLEDWLAEVSSDRSLDRTERRAVRRATRLAIKLARAAPSEPDWMQAVDATLGSAGWQPTLDLAQHGLEVDPSPELFAEMQHRFRMVYLRPWMDGIDYEEYLAGRAD